ncbi:uncharacterized protein LOC134807349 isoform X2 [Pan troglodytes]|uniref:uncharacterized protein LOC134807349 isoform X2 n=1 Tax=Pan troglodytes TaxID=9598 RepID=UPI0007DBBAE5
MVRTRSHKKRNTFILSYLYCVLVKNATKSSVDKRGNKNVGGDTTSNDWHTSSLPGTALDVFVTHTNYCIWSHIYSSCITNGISILVILAFYLHGSIYSIIRKDTFTILGVLYFSSKHQKWQTPFGISVHINHLGVVCGKYSQPLGIPSKKEKKIKMQFMAEGDPFSAY